MISPTAGTLPFVTVSGEDLEGVDGPSALLAKARGGSLLFDEVGDLPDEAEARIVRMLDQLTDNSPRIMATSQVDLMSKMEAGEFRQDLFYRLSGVTMTVPALRERVDDIPLLADHFLGRAVREGANQRRLSADAVELVRTYYLARKRAPAGKCDPSPRGHRRRG